MIDLSAISNMPELLTALEDNREGCVLLRHMESGPVVEVLAEDFFRQVRQCAHALAARNLSGKHVGITGANTTRWLIHFCALHMIGAVTVLLGPELNAQELKERTDLADVEFLFHDGSAETELPSAVMNYDWEEYPDAPLPYPEPAPEDLACILFTSGTTAAGKAVMLSHRAMVAGSCHNVVGHFFEAQLAILPMHHVAGFATVLNTWYLGRTVCLGQDFKYLYRYLEHMQPDYVLTVPSILQAIVKKLKRGSAPGWNLKLIGCGGAKFQPEVIQTLNDLGIRVLQSYGATEAGGIGFDWEMTPECRDTIGKPCPEMEVKIVDGELWLRSASVMSGYYKDPEGTAQVLHDGWYATGDLCSRDSDGYLHLTGRKKNLIILPNGENVSPEEIEIRLSGCCWIEEIMVGLENSLITATIHPTDGSPDTKDRIRDAVTAYNRGVPPYKQIQNLRFSDVPFAKTAIGKIIRRSVTEGESQ